MSTEVNEETERRLHKRDLATSAAPAVLGLIVVRQLLEFGQSSVYLDDEGYVAVAAPGEISLDSLPEPMAINTLVDQGWTDEEVANYLRGRDTRLKSGG
jgi:hypothetical protein